MERNFSINGKDHYVRALEVHRQKSGNLVNNNAFLNLHLPPLIENMVKKRKPENQFLNILSVGSGTGKTDFEIIKIVQKVLDKLGCRVKIFNRAVEPSGASLKLYKETLVSRNDRSADTEFDLCQYTFEAYKETKKDDTKFDLIHFIHSAYYLDVKKSLALCFEEELKPHGIITCFVVGKDVLYQCCTKQGLGHAWHGGNSTTEGWMTADDIAAIADESGWMHQLFNQEYPVDVTEVFDEESVDGNLLLDFMTYAQEFRKTADKKKVEETLELIRDLSTVKDGKRLAKRKDQLLFLYK